MLISGRFSLESKKNRMCLCIKYLFWPYDKYINS